jgi:hypothetical protein
LSASEERVRREVLFDVGGRVTQSWELAGVESADDQPPLS